MSKRANLAVVTTAVCVAAAGGWAFAQTDASTGGPQTGSSYPSTVQGQPSGSQTAAGTTSDSNVGNAGNTPGTMNSNTTADSGTMGSADSGMSPARIDRN